MGINSLYAAVTRRDDLNEIRITNWAYWSMGGYPKLDYPSWMEIWRGYIREFNITRAVAEQDAQDIEEAVTTMDIYCRKNTDPDALGVSKWGTLEAYIMKLHYVEKRDRTNIHLAEITSREFKRPVAKSTYEKWLTQAKRDVMILAPSI